MESNESTMEGTRLDIDLEAVTSANAVLPGGTYTLQLHSIKMDKSGSGRPMIRSSYMARHPETAENVFINDYPLLDTQQGKFRLRQIIEGSGQSPAAGQYTLEECIGKQYEAEIEETGDDFGNRIKRLLVDIRK